jgi:hypothetical protein
MTIMITITTITITTITITITTEQRVVELARSTAAEYGQVFGLPFTGSFSKRQGWWFDRGKPTPAESLYPGNRSTYRDLTE